ncbi:MAG: tail fiber domain-containing protein [Nitrospiraceae bacterium]|nr:MAG: tail fiber domain-containing protein [Nitrospiraceae bacterium]
MKKIVFAMIIGFFIAGSHVFAQDMIIDSYGNIGMGITNPDHGLHIAGINAALHIDGIEDPPYYYGGRLTFGDLAADVYIGEVVDDVIEISASEIRLTTGALNFTTANVGFNQPLPIYPIHMASGAHVTTGGVWTDASSRELKENIRDLQYGEASDALAKLKPQKFNYKNEKKEEYLGFIAEDVPELVAKNDRKGLSPMDIVAVLTKVVQQQQKLIEEHKKSLTTLSNKVNDLDRELKLKGNLASANNIN